MKHIVPIIALLVGSPLPGYAQTAPMLVHGNAEMNVALNKSQTLRVEQPIARALIGNSEIADVLPTSIRAVYVMGKKIGVTNLTLLDRKGGVIAVVDVVVGPDTQGLKRRLSELMPSEHVGVSVSNDSIVLEGKVSSAAAAERAAIVAETFAPKKVINLMNVGQPQQVLLEVRFAEMSRGTVKALGINSLTVFNGAIRTTNTTVGNGAITQNGLTANGPLAGGYSVPQIDPKANPFNSSPTSSARASRSRSTRWSSRASSIRSPSPIWLRSRERPRVSLLAASSRCRRASTRTAACRSSSSSSESRSPSCRP